MWAQLQATNDLPQRHLLKKNKWKEFQDICGLMLQIVSSVSQKEEKSHPEVMLNDFSHRVIEYRWSTTAKALELIQMHEMKKGKQ